MFWQHKALHSLYAKVKVVDVVSLLVDVRALCFKSRTHFRRNPRQKVATTDTAKEIELYKVVFVDFL